MSRTPLDKWRDHNDCEEQSSFRPLAHKYIVKIIKIIL